MAQHITVGTRFNVLGTRQGPLDTTYVVERIRVHAAAGQKTYTLEVRTERQRCYDRLLTGYTRWSSAYVRDCLAKGNMEVCPSKRSPPWAGPPCP